MNPLVLRKYQNVDEYEPGRWQFNSVKDAKAAFRELDAQTPNTYYRNGDVVGLKDSGG